MSFNAPLFLFVFLPVFLLVYLLAGGRLRNGWLLTASLAFYLWAAPLYFPLLLLTLLLNFWFARLAGQRTARPLAARRALWLGIVFNIGTLAFFKIIVRYWMVLAAEAALPPSLTLYLQNHLTFPLGLSFLTFQAVASLVDAYQGRGERIERFFPYALYLLLFPKLIAGPIVRYREIAGQIADRAVTAQGMADGARRFILGLAKKTLIADMLRPLTDYGVFALSVPSLPAGSAWLVLLAYTLQIYYDFSGYTDMAIGLGRMAGFNFAENFNYPYIAKSLSEFWRRWHITLSGWFREYIFYPLERRRHGRGGLRQSVNILIVFVLTGLWHGVTPNFILWGGLHGTAIALEAGSPGKILKRLPVVFQHLYAMLIIMVGWVFFRSSTPAYALGFLKSMLGLTEAHTPPFSILPPPEAPLWLAMAAGVIFSLPVIPWLKKRWSSLTAERPRLAIAGGIFRDAALLGLLIVSVFVLSAATYQPYIYGKF